MKRRLAWAGLWLLLSMPVKAEILTLYSDNGLPGVPATNSVVTYSGGSGSFDGSSTDVAPPEGFTSWKTQDPSNQFVGWGMAFGAPQNLARFNSGELRFWIYSNTGNIQIEIKQPGGANGIDVLSKNLATDLGWTVASANKWVEYRIPLAAVPLNQIQNPFLFTALSGPSLPILFYIDNVRYVDSTTSPLFNVKLCNIGDVSCAASPTQITWTGALAASSWVKADQYIQLTVDPDATAWGVQIYTDNTAIDASPKFTSAAPSGQPGSNPAGLIDTTVPSLSLSMAWSIHPDTTSTVATAGDPNVDAEWFYMQDKATPNIPALTTGAFSNGAPYVIAKNNQGIQYNPTLFGAVQVPPNPIYLEANFNTAMGGRTYKTSTLRVEYFYP